MNPTERQKRYSEIAESIYKTLGSHSNWFAIKQSIIQALTKVAEENEAELISKRTKYAFYKAFAEDKVEQLQEQVKKLTEENNRLQESEVLKQYSRARDNWAKAELENSQLLDQVGKLRLALEKISKEHAWTDKGHQCESRQRLEACIQRSKEALSPPSPQLHRLREEVITQAREVVRILQIDNLKPVKALEEAITTLDEQGKGNCNG